MNKVRTGTSISLTFAMNSSVSKTTKCTSYRIFYGNNSRLPFDFLIENPDISHEFEPIGYADNLGRLLKESYEIESQNQTFYHDRVIRQVEYKVGDKVKFLVKATKMTDVRKFKRKWKGPCTV